MEGKEVKKASVDFLWEGVGLSDGDKDGGGAEFSIRCGGKYAELAFFEGPAHLIRPSFSSYLVAIGVPHDGIDGTGDIHFERKGRILRGDGAIKDIA